ncbi:MAG: hypothetical protein Q8Q04_00410 [archaeon]|nr:hypothetical protein [archaeon]
MVNIFDKNKKGQGLSTSTIILLILGIIILVILVWGFITGWSAFQPLVNPTNVDDVIRDCNSACSIQSKFSYCSADRTLNVNEDKLKVKSSCAVFSSASNFAKYSILSCPAIVCDLACSDIKIDGKAGNPDLNSGTYDLSSLANEEACFIN